MSLFVVLDWFRNLFHNNICEKTKAALHQLLMSTRSNAYFISGKYKGIYIKESPFITALEPYVIVENDVSKLMDYILGMTIHSGPVIASSYNISDILNTNPVDNDDSIDHHPVAFEQNGEQIESTYGSTSDICVKLSQTHTEYEEIVEDQFSSTTNSFL